MPGGRPKQQYSQALRLLKIWERLHIRTHMTIPQLVAEFSVDRRTIQRDLTALMEHYAVEEGERTENGEKTFRLKPTARVEPLKLTVNEMLALYMGKNMFSFTRGTQLSAAMDSIYDKLQARLCDKNVQVRDKLPKKLYCTTGFPKRYADTDDVLNAVLTGVLKENKVAITYRIPNKPSYQDTIHPYTLVAHNNAFYVVAHSELAGEQRMFGLERIIEAEWKKNEPFEFPAAYDPSRHFEAAFGITAGGARTNVRLVFTPEVAPYVQARQWHPSQRLKPRRDGGLELAMSVGVGEELVHWLTGYGGNVRVCSPKWLRLAVNERHAAGVRVSR